MQTPLPLKQNFYLTALALLVFILSTSFGEIQTEVYICKGKYSKKYHYKKKCRGLSNCSTSTYKVKLSEAKNLGRTLCGWED